MDKEIIVMQQVLNRIDTLLELDPGTLSGSERLEGLENWDSLSIIGFIAMADEEFSVQVAPTAIHQAETINDLIKLLGNRNAL